MKRIHTQNNTNNKGKRSLKLDIAASRAGIVILIQHFRSCRATI